MSGDNPAGTDGEPKEPITSLKKKADIFNNRKKDYQSQKQQNRIFTTRLPGRCAAAPQARGFYCAGKQGSAVTVDPAKKQLIKIVSAKY
ncbi:hypothetical protein CRQ24_23470 [Salmonella enterica subsp. enterica serovar Derby]|nr:hypothetical protein [Salmonella enterica subsp. enterica serovar Derby]EDZ3589405.1 hypothetical protein [Salmonella enterica subsp. enterica serovar Wagenia]